MKYIRIYKFSHLVWPLTRSPWLFLFVIIYVGNSIIKNSNISSSCIMKSKCNFLIWFKISLFKLSFIDRVLSGRMAKEIFFVVRLNSIGENFKIFLSNDFSQICFFLQRKKDRSILSDTVHYRFFFFFIFLPSFLFIFLYLHRVTFSSCRIFLRRDNFFHVHTRGYLYYKLRDEKTRFNRSDR